MQDALYASLVTWLRGTLKTCPENVDAVLAQSRRSYADLMADALARGASERPTCEQCGGDVVVITSKRIGDSQKQRTKCKACQHRGWHYLERPRIAYRQRF